MRERERLYWNVVREVRHRNGFVGKIVQDIVVPTVERRNEGEMCNNGTLRFVIASVAIGVGFVVRYEDCVYAIPLILMVVFIVHKWVYYSNKSRLECVVDEVTSKVKELLREIQRTNQTLRDTTKAICRAELVARGYRPGSSCAKMPPVARIESPPLHCMPLRRAVYSTSRDCIECLKKSSTRLSKDDDEEEHDDKIAIAQKPKEDLLRIRVLNEMQRRFRLAVQLFLCDLIECVNEFSKQQEKDNDEKLSIDWIQRLYKNVISPLCHDLQLLCEILSREAVVKTTQRNNNKDLKTPPTKVALRHVLLELRSHLDTMSSYVVLCEQSIIEEENSTSFLDCVQEANRLCEESTKHTESLWKAAEKLAILMDKGCTDMTKVEERKTKNLVVSPKIPSKADGMWEHHSCQVQNDCKTCDDEDNSVVTKVYTGETEKENAVDDNGIVLPLALKLSASVLGDLRSKLQSRRDDDVHRKQQEIPVREVVDKNDENVDEKTFVVTSSTSTLRSELKSVISRRLRRYNDDNEEP
jgi:hypothetical protein